MLLRIMAITLLGCSIAVGQTRMPPTVNEQALADQLSAEIQTNLMLRRELIETRAQLETLLRAKKDEKKNQVDPKAPAE